MNRNVCQARTILHLADADGRNFRQEDSHTTTITTTTLDADTLPAVYTLLVVYVQCSPLRG